MENDSDSHRRWCTLCRRCLDRECQASAGRGNPCTISMVAVRRGRCRVRKKVGLKVTRPNVISAQQEDERTDTEQINPSWCLSHKSATVREKRRPTPERVDGLPPSQHELLLQDKSSGHGSNQARMPSPLLARHTFAGVCSKRPCRACAKSSIHCTQNGPADSLLPARPCTRPVSASIVRKGEKHQRPS